MCPETKNLVCCSGVESNLQIEFSAAEISESNPLSVLEEFQLQALFRWRTNILKFTHFTYFFQILSLYSALFFCLCILVYYHIVPLYFLRFVKPKKLYNSN